VGYFRQRAARSEAETPSRTPLSPLPARGSPAEGADAEVLEEVPKAALLFPGGGRFWNWGCERGEARLGVGVLCW
jgi:hypothetical protein